LLCFMLSKVGLSKVHSTVCKFVVSEDIHVFLVITKHSIELLN